MENKIWQNILATGDNMTSYVKQGNYKLEAGLSDQYFIHEKQKVFIKFKAIDTLYYMDYSFDTSTVISISKSGAGKTISGYTCNPITIKTQAGERKVYYAPALYLNPEYDKNNTIGQLNVLSRETSSIWLESIWKRTHTPLPIPAPNWYRKILAIRYLTCRHCPRKNLP